MLTHNNIPQPTQHNNDKLELAKRLNLSLKQFDYLLSSANSVHDILTELGPFYGRETIKEPTFRITAEPVILPHGSKKLLDQFGNDLLHLGKVLPKLPENMKSKLGSNLDFRIPLTWRIDSIIDTNDKININEIEGIDSVSALMMTEQLAYHLQSTRESTVAIFASTLKKMYPQNFPLLIAIIRTDIENNPFTPNARRFIEFLERISNGEIKCDLLDIDQLKNSSIKPNWSNYTAIINEAYASLNELEKIGIVKEKLLNAGNYNAFINKGVFALLFDPLLTAFWKNGIGLERHERLKSILIPTSFANTEEDLKKARKEGKVCKVSWAEDNIIIINRVKGVAMPIKDLLEGEDERWKFLEECLHKGNRVIIQDFVEPTRISAFLRKKSTNLEHVDWYNRLCVKYVCDGNPNHVDIPTTQITAAEVTLGPEIIPAGRACAFTAGKLQ